MRATVGSIACCLLSFPVRAESDARPVAEGQVTNQPEQPAASREPAPGAGLAEGVASPQVQVLEPLPWRAGAYTGQGMQRQGGRAQDE
jgi:hypothetical protein